MKTINDYRIWENPDKCEVKITQTEKLKEAKWIKTENISYEIDWVPAENSWEKVVRTTANWVVAVLPVTKEWNIILTQEMRIPMISEDYNGSVIWMPAWLVDDNENKIEATKREMQEEIWFESEQVEYIDSIVSSEGMTDEEIDVFIALNVTQVDKILDEDFKNIDWFFLKHIWWENIKSIYSVPYKEIYDFMDMARKEWMKKGWKIDCALNHFERKFKDKVFSN